MTSNDAGRIAELMHDVHLAVAVAFFEGDYQLVVDYSDMKPHRNGEPRTQTTHMNALYALMNVRGVRYGLSTAVCPHDGLQRLVFTKAREQVKHG